MNIISTVVIAFIITFCLPYKAHSCDCRGSAGNWDEGSIAVQYIQSSIIFEGVAEEVTTGKINGMDGEYYFTRFSVKNVWKGDIPDKMVIKTDIGSASCGMGFPIGATYLIYARHDENGYYTNSCSGNLVDKSLDEFLEDKNSNYAYYQKSLGENQAKKMFINIVESFKEAISVLDRFKSSPELAESILEERGSRCLRDGVKIIPDGIKAGSNLQANTLSGKLVISKLRFIIEDICKEIDRLSEFKNLQKEFSVKGKPAPTLYEINKIVKERSFLGFNKPIRYKNIEIPADKNILEIAAIKFSALSQMIILNENDFIIPDDTYEITFRWETAFGKTFSDTINVKIELEKDK